jgi:hypothetical protein
MGLLLSEIIVDVLRQAVPIVGAVTGAYIGMKRAQRTGKRPIVTVASFSGIGWVAGYALNRGIMRILDGRSPQLPSENLPMPMHNVPPAPLFPPSSMEAAPPVPSAPAPFNASATGGLPDLPHALVQSTPAIPPKTANEGVEYGPAKKRASASPTLKLGAFGQLYGNE